MTVTPAEAINYIMQDQKNHHSAEQKATGRSSPASSPPAGRWKRLQDWGWFWETLCCIPLIAALITLVSVIAKAQDQPFAAWRHHHANISISAVVSVLSAILKGSCMFIIAEVIGQAKWNWFRNARRLRDFNRIDNASRGPLGSARILCRPRVPTLVFLGSVVTVVAIAIDPFLQNIITTSPCQTASPNQTAFVPTADVYNTYRTLPVDDPILPSAFRLWGRPRFDIDPPLRASIYAGLYGSATAVINASTIRPYCPGVNCTFTRYTTLGVCHRCADISSLVKHVCDTKNILGDGVFYPACTWSLPGDQLLKSYAAKEDSINFAVAKSSLSTVALPHIPGTFTNFTILANASTEPRCTTTMADINSGCSTPMGAPTFPFQTVAFECSLFACIRTYTASVTDGSVVETEVKRSFGQTDWLTGENNPPGILRPLDMRFIPKEENCTFKERVKNQNSSLCTYNFNSISLLALGNFFWDFWNGTVAGKYFEHASSRNDAMDILYGGGITNFTHISGTLGGIADSMTAAIRLTGRVFDQDYGSGGGQGKVTGSVMISNTCIDVRWGWITLPAAVALLTLLLLASTVLLDRLKPDQPAWKTSSLPTLFHGLDPTELTNKEQLLTVTAMGKEAKGLWVKLTDEKSDTLHLKTCTQEGQAITRPLEAENSASTLTDIHMSQNHRRTW